MGRLEAVRIAVVVYAVVGTMVATFLVGLASGASWTTRAVHRVTGASGTSLGASGRALALLTAVTHLLSVGVVAIAAGLTWPRYAAAAYPLLWIVAFYDGLATIIQANASRRSLWARRVWAPTCLVLTACIAVVLIGTW